MRWAVRVGRWTMLAGLGSVGFLFSGCGWWVRPYLGLQVWAEATGPRESSGVGLTYGCWTRFGSRDPALGSNFVSFTRLPGVLSDDLSLSSLTSFRRPFPPFFPPFSSLFLPLIPFLVLVWLVKVSHSRIWKGSKIRRFVSLADDVQRVGLV